MDAVPADATERAQRTERVNVRLTPDDDAMLRAAAAARHKTLTAFVLDAAREEARAVLDAERRIVVSAETFDRLVEELERPAQVIEPLRALMRRVAADDAARRSEQPSG